ncbi:glycoside hydrolase family 26 protein [Actinocorallia longicatena]|uniref:Glycosyl hydrolase n=1 Tax=Actinocorallia longicatena TaxID=111803 RepID=A0ABP6QCZ5_9ACTN
MKRRVLVAAVLLAPMLTGVADAAPKQAPKPAKARYNNPAPKGFKRWNAPGVAKVTKYIYPKREYVGLFTPGPDKVADAARFGRATGRKPNIIKNFYNWGDDYDAAWATGVWKSGALPQLELELWPRGRGITMATIAAGAEDAYIRRLALGIRAAKIPVIFSFAHEFNAEWYPWGTCSRPQADDPAVENACDYMNTPAQWVAAWRRMHSIFWKAGASNAIWMWQPNETGSRPEIKLRKYWPGANYVDWVGVVGYQRGTRKKTFNGLFIPTFKQIRTFTKKPIIIPETGASTGKIRNAYIKDFLAGVAHYPNVIGFIWFNADKRPAERDGDFVLEHQKSSVKVFKKALTKGAFGFKVK